MNALDGTYLVTPATMDPVGFTVTNSKGQLDYSNNWVGGTTVLESVDNPAVGFINIR